MEQPTRTLTYTLTISAPVLPEDWLAPLEQSPSSNDEPLEELGHVAVTVDKDTSRQSPWDTILRYSVTWSRRAQVRRRKSNVSSGKGRVGEGNSSGQRSTMLDSSSTQGENSSISGLYQILQLKANGIRASSNQTLPLSTACSTPNRLVTQPQIAESALQQVALHPVSEIESAESAIHQVSAVKHADSALCQVPTVKSAESALCHSPAIKFATSTHQSVVVTNSSSSQCSYLQSLSTQLNGPASLALSPSKSDQSHSLSSCIEPVVANGPLPSSGISSPSQTVANLGPNTHRQISPVSLSGSHGALPQSPSDSGEVVKMCPVGGVASNAIAEDAVTATLLFANADSALFNSDPYEYEIVKVSNDRVIGSGKEVGVVPMETDTSHKESGKEVNTVPMETDTTHKGSGKEVNTVPMEIGVAHKESGKEVDAVPMETDKTKLAASEETTTSRELSIEKEGGASFKEIATEHKKSKSVDSSSVDEERDTFREGEAEKEVAMKIESCESVCVTFDVVEKENENTDAAARLEGANNSERGKESGEELTRESAKVENEERTQNRSVENESSKLTMPEMTTPTSTTIERLPMLASTTTTCMNIVNSSTTELPALTVSPPTTAQSLPTIAHTSPITAQSPPTIAQTSPIQSPPLSPSLAVYQNMTYVPCISNNYLYLYPVATSSLVDHTPLAQNPTHLQVLATPPGNMMQPLQSSRSSQKKNKFPNKKGVNRFKIPKCRRTPKSHGSTPPKPRPLAASRVTHGVSSEEAVAKSLCLRRKEAGLPTNPFCLTYTVTSSAGHSWAANSLEGKGVGEKARERERERE